MKTSATFPNLKQELKRLRTTDLTKAVAWLDKNKKSLKPQDIFDYPDYWGMPKSISNKLTGDEVDWLQAELHLWTTYTIDENENEL